MTANKAKIGIYERFDNGNLFWKNEVPKGMIRSLMPADEIKKKAVDRIENWWYRKTLVCDEKEAEESHYPKKQACYECDKLLLRKPQHVFSWRYRLGGERVYGDYVIYCVKCFRYKMYSWCTTNKRFPILRYDGVNFVDEKDYYVKLTRREKKKVNHIVMPKEYDCDQSTRASHFHKDGVHFFDQFEPENEISNATI
jgi:hypothetical protein